MSMDDERERRIGLNEAVFREVNERIQDVAASSEGSNQPLNLVCECGDPTCVQHIELARAEYEAVRADPTHFAVYPGHEIPDVEDVVDKRSGYDVIRKQAGAAAKVAEETDPRS
jgi:hypothetical protein